MWSKNPGTNGSDLPIIRCPCGAGPCRNRVSKTERNPDRRFFTCPCGCGFFVWCDQVKVLDCRCGAGACSISMVTSGPDVGRWFYACRIKQGHGACGFFQWVDPELNFRLNMASKRFTRHNQSTVIRSNSVSTINNDLNLCKPSFERQQSEHIEDSEVVCISQHPRNPLVVPDSVGNDELLLAESQQYDATSEIAHSKHNELQPVMSCENECHASLSTGSDQVEPLMAEENEYAVSLSTSGDRVGRSISCLLSHSDIYCHQLKVWHQISVCGILLNCGIVCAFGLPITGWLGRLAFSPSRILFDPPPSTPFCCVFPSFNAIEVPKPVNILKPGTILSNAKVDGLTESPTHESQLLHDPLSHKRSFNAIQEDISRGPIVEGFVNRLAMRLQNELVTLLKSMEPQDHTTMLQAAEAAFIALAGLSVEFGLFSEDVLEYIHCASRVALIETSLQNGCSLQELIEQYIIENLKFDEVSQIHAEAMTAVTVSDKYLQSVRDAVTRVKNVLLLIETQLNYCEANTLKLGAYVKEISRDKEEHRGRMQTALKEVETAFNLQQQKEKEKYEANLALEEARIKLIMHL